MRHFEFSFFFSFSTDNIIVKILQVIKLKVQPQPLLFHFNYHFNHVYWYFTSCQPVQFYQGSILIILNQTCASTLSCEDFDVNPSALTSLAMSCLAPYVSCLRCLRPENRATSSTFLSTSQRCHQINQTNRYPRNCLHDVIWLWC